jgi:hypothetical protein
MAGKKVKQEKMEGARAETSTVKESAFLALVTSVMNVCGQHTTYAAALSA